MDYTLICENNRALYGRMERLLKSIKYYANNRMLTEEAEARLEYAEVMLQIDIGLQRLEDFWKMNGEMYIAQTGEAEILSINKTSKMQAVINAFLDNPKMNVKEIAAICCVHTSTAAEIISNWYKQSKGATIREAPA
jgi:hypothetical protein